jgi:hypothetical protein
MILKPVAITRVKKTQFAHGKLILQRVENSMLSVDYLLNCPQDADKYHGEKSSTDFYTVIRDRTIYIVFEGTDVKEWRDIRTDLDCTLKYDNIFAVHRGFWKAYIFEKPELINRLVRSGCSFVRILGYSLGAALATLAFNDLEPLFPEKVFECEVFGCPRVGNKHYAKAYPKVNYKRYENGNDVITKLPPWIFGYRHIGEAIHLGTKRCWWCWSFKDHILSNYAKNYKEHYNVS